MAEQALTTVPPEPPDPRNISLFEKPLAEEQNFGNESATPPQPIEPDHELQRAMADGWVDIDHWRGDKSKWVDYPEFNRRGDEILPIVKSKLQQELTARDQKIAELEEKLSTKFKIVDEVRQVQQDQVKAAAKYNNDILRQEYKQALENQDWDKATEINDKLLEVKIAERTAAQAQPAREQQELDAMKQQLVKYSETNPWIKDNGLLRSANLIAAELRRYGETAQGVEFLEIVKEELQSRFPAKFNGRRSPAMVEGGGSIGAAGGRSMRKTYENLKPDFKAACDRLADQGKLTKEKFLANCDDDAFRG